MPVYEYECSGCQKILEVQQRMTDEPLSVCPECGAGMRKLISRTSFLLKGGGWYTDGYSNGKTCAPCAESDSAPSCPAGSGSCCSSCPAAT
ncbi:MAG: zinc ribbon domain-containing protein [Proteobacteria bacterium]|nr:zinc ribbon domain-containing protein [Pseudomonadota bacterium]